MMRSLFASALLVAAVTAVDVPDVTQLVTFDGVKETTWSWRVINDPVMGGLSHSTWKIANKTAIWDGEVLVVPKLKAPGFCNALTTNLFARAADVSAYSHLEIVVRSAVAYQGWKVSFAADTLNTLFGSFKADFNVTKLNEWVTITIPFNHFSNKWSSYTGEPTTPCSSAHPEVCPSKKNLRDISTIGVWTEGAAGKFHIEILSIGATNASTKHVTETLYKKSEKVEEKAKQDWKSHCTAPIQPHLNFNCSNRAPDLPGPAAPDESLADAVCCDKNFAPFAEPQFFFEREDIALFDRIDSKGTTTFYDSVCGIPLFTAPQGRTFEEWKAESHLHGWPSFRVQEIVGDNVRIDPVTQKVYSKCNTKLGSNEKDDKGARYCLNLVCLSGNKA